MLERILKFSVSQRYLVVLFTLAATGIGMYSFAEARGNGDNPRQFLSEKLILNYLNISAALAADSTKGIDAKAKQIVAETGYFLKETKSGSEESRLLESAKIINMNAKLLGNGKNDLKAARQIFAVISDELSWIFSEHYKGPDRGEYHIFHCPMVGHYWFQKSPKIRNPYFGKSMQECGSEVKKVIRATAIDKGKEEHDPFAVVDAPPSSRAEGIMKNLKCACCGQPLLTTACGCAANARMQVKRAITEMEDRGLKDAEIITRLREKFGKRVVPEELSKEDSK